MRTTVVHLSYEQAYNILHALIDQDCGEECEYCEVNRELITHLRKVTDEWPEER